ncbi:MAG: hypothetical protein Q4E89_00700 [Eubacteriales bacterium]|nr:hypothetical protein [Eubacteriales bacterium]
MKRVKKGDFGYFAYEKKKRLLITGILLAVPLLIFASGWIYHGTRNNVLTVVATVGCLPACKSAVGLIMMWMRKSMDKTLYEQILAHAGQLVMSYEMYITFYEKNGYIDAFAVCGNEVVGYTSDASVDAAFMEENIQKIVRKNGYKVNVKILKDLRPYLERLDSMNEHRETLEENIKFRPDERYPDLSRNELIKHTILAISL